MPPYSEINGPPRVGTSPQSVALAPAAHHPRAAGVQSQRSRRRLTEAGGVSPALIDRNLLALDATRPSGDAAFSRQREWDARAISRRRRWNVAVFGFCTGWRRLQGEVHISGLAGDAGVSAVGAPKMYLYLPWVKRNMARRDLGCGLRSPNAWVLGSRGAEAEFLSLVAGRGDLAVERGLPFSARSYVRARGRRRAAPAAGTLCLMAFDLLAASGACPGAFMAGSTDRSRGRRGHDDERAHPRPTLRRNADRRPRPRQRARELRECRAEQISACDRPPCPSSEACPSLLTPLITPQGACVADNGW